MPGKKVLCVSFDRTVSDSRNNALTQAGYEVTSTTDLQQASQLLKAIDFDVVIIGHRFSTEEKRLFAVEAAKKPNCFVLLVCGASRNSEIPVSSRVYALEGNIGLVSALAAASLARPA
jgi:DNA-binding response OmpR family regulator